MALCLTWPSAPAEVRRERLRTALHATRQHAGSRCYHTWVAACTTGCMHHTGFMLLGSYAVTLVHLVSGGIVTLLDGAGLAAKRGADLSVAELGLQPCNPATMQPCSPATMQPCSPAGCAPGARLVHAWCTQAATRRVPGAPAGGAATGQVLLLQR